MTKTFRGYTPIEKPSFDLESPDGSRKVTITCVAFLPGSKFLDFLSNADQDNPGSLASAVNDLLVAAIGPDSWSQFREFVDNADNGVSMEMLAEIAGYLGELYSGRPTERSQV